MTDCSVPGRRPDVPASVVFEELASLDVATEELRVAEEELGMQREHIAALLAQHETDQRWRSQLAGVLPVGLAVTDGTGLLVEVNPAFAETLGIPLARLHHKPLSVYLAERDRRWLRSALYELASGVVDQRQATVTMQPRGSAPLSAELAGFPEFPDARPAAARVQWVLQPHQQSHVGAPPGAVPAEGAAAPVPPAAGRPDASRGEQAASIIGVAASFAQLSALPVGGPERERLLGRMAALVQRAVPAADWVSITIGSPAAPERQGSDSREAQVCDGLQQRTEQGPCFDAFSSGELTVTGDLPADPRWPQLARLAARGAVRSVLAIPLREEDTSGVINVYAGGREAFGAAGRGLAEVAAAAVAGVLRNLAERQAVETLAANLEKALSSRATIDQAKGMLMARAGISADDAFARLVALSSRLNVKVRDLAQRLVEGDADTLDAAVG